MRDKITSLNPWNTRQMRRSVSKVDFDFNLSADIRTITAVSHISFPQRDIKVTNEKFSSS